MADHQKIYPTPDVEAPPQPLQQSPRPSAPLIPPNTTKSDQGDVADPPPPIRRTIPPYYSKPPKRRSCCCRCLCCFLGFLITFIVTIAILAGVFYLIFHPKLPKYSIDSLRITSFNVSNNNSLSATFDVNLTARNPNKKIGIYYLDGSWISVSFGDTELCTGSLPTFYQGHRNTTVMDVELSGETQDASNLMTAVQEQEKQTGNIPLVVRAKVPVKIKFGKLKTRKMKFKATCHLIVDSLSASSSEIRISSSSCKIKPHF
ncbi:hypothetical protein Ancab_023892 [Ancistrocladus abbreviatus]